MFARSTDELYVAYSGKLLRYLYAGGYDPEPHLFHFDGKAWLKVDVPAKGHVAGLAGNASDLWVFFSETIPVGERMATWGDASQSRIRGGVTRGDGSSSRSLRRRCCVRQRGPSQRSPSSPCLGSRDRDASTSSTDSIAAREPDDSARAPEIAGDDSTAPLSSSRA